MIAEVKAFATLKGFRGKPAGDLDALAQRHRGAVAPGVAE